MPITDTLIQSIIAQRGNGKPIVEPIQVSSDIELRQNEVIVLVSYKGEGSLYAANSMYKPGQETETICQGFINFINNVNLVATGYKITFM